MRKHNLVPTEVPKLRDSIKLVKLCEAAENFRLAVERGSHDVNVSKSDMSFCTELLAS